MSYSLYWGMSLSDHVNLPKRIVKGKIKFFGNKSSEIGFRRIVGESFDELRDLFHKDIDLFFEALNQRLALNDVAK